jgi:hypothetical protein
MMIVSASSIALWENLLSPIVGIHSREARRFQGVLESHPVLLQEAPILQPTQWHMLCKSPWTSSCGRVELIVPEVLSLE